MTTYDWADAFKAPGPFKVPDGTTPVTPIESVRATKYALAALEDEAALVATAAEGTRNDALNRAAFRLGRHVGAGYIDADTVRQALNRAGHAAGLPQDEIDLVLRNDPTAAINQGAASPREARPLTPVPEVTVLPAPTGDTEADAAAISNAVRNRFPILDWHELWGREDVEEWIVEPILPARRLVALFSAPKVGKSLLMLEIAVAVAQGTTVLGTTPDRTRRVLYVDFENDPRGDIYERLTAMGHTPDHLANLCYLSYPTIAKLDTHAGAAELMAIVAEYECEVVVIDTISRAVAGEENENDTWLNFYRNTGLAMKQAGIACIRLDHTGKDHDKGMRGGSAKYGDVDAVWKLGRVTDETYTLVCTDNRLPIAEKNLTIKRLTAPHLHHKVDGGGPSAARDAKIDQIITAMDDAGLPHAAGAPAAKVTLKAADIHASAMVIAEAVKTRKIRAGVYTLDDA